MRHRQNARPFAKPAALLAIGAGLGLFASMQVVALIRDARSIGAFGAAPIPPAVAPKAAKPTEEERAMAHALAAAIGAQTLEDCRRLEPRHRPGCQAYIERREDDLFADRRDGSTAAIAPSAPSR